MPDGSIVLMGGRSGSTDLNDVWRSTDNGGNWTRQTASAGWSARYSHTSVVMPDGSIILMGGASGTGMLFVSENDVWRSTDMGVTWTRMTAHAGWMARYLHASVAMPDGRVLMLGGAATSLVNDVWQSADNGATWTVVNYTPEWSRRYLHSASVMPDGSIILMGGYDYLGGQNDVWRSVDYGNMWTQLADAGWAARQSYSTATSRDGSIYMMGGFDTVLRNDTWRFQPIGSSLQNPIHTYSVPGSYNVSLQAFNSAGYNNTRKIGFITVTASTPGAGFTSNVVSGYPQFNVQFTDLSGNTPTAWYWDFGDGRTSAAQNPNNWYRTVIGNNIVTYTVLLNASNSGGFDWENKTSYITAYPINTAFSANSTSGNYSKAVLFTSSITNGTATTWSWNFGDGATSTSQNPIHTYTVAGTYNVTLNASNLYSYDWENKTSYIAIGTSPTTPPIAAFNSNVTSGYSSVSVQFEDTSTNTPTTWLWEFGDGETSTVQNPNHLYNRSIGNVTTMYNVSMSAGNVGGSDWENKTSYITVYPINSAFGANSTSGNFPKPVLFTDTSTNGTATSWNWSFGDGTFSELKNPVHTYTSAGSYSVTMNASTGYSFDVESKSSFITIGTSGSVAAFNSNVTSGYPAFTVQFTDTSGNTPTSWYWEFGDGATSTSQSPVHTYNTAIGSTTATYTVKLNASNVGGFDWENKTAYITAYPINAAFSANSTGGTFPLAILFTDTTANGVPTSWYWDFGDGTTSTSQNPVHTYTASGYYTVRFQAGNVYTSDWENKTSYITIGNPTYSATFDADPASGSSPLLVTFTDTTDPPATSWTWDFGDGTTSNLKNPTHQFNSGDYTVILHTSTAYGGGSGSVVIHAAVGPTTIPTSMPLTEPILTAKFIGEPLMGNPPHWIQFFDKSIGMAHTVEYDFGDGTPISSDPNPIHCYVSSGKYDVTLTVRGTGDYSGMNSKYTNYGMVNVLGAVTPGPTTTFGEQSKQMQNSYSNITMYGEILPTAYSNAMGSAGLYLFFGLFFGFIFLAMFARMGDTTMLALFGITISGIVTSTGMLTSFIPIEFTRISQGFLILCVAGLLYSLWRGR
jgi:PKD repeat protein